MKAETIDNEWFSVTVTANIDAEMAVDTAFGVLASIGTEIDLLSKSKAGEVSIVGYFESEPAESHVKRIIGESLLNFGLASDTVRQIEFASVPEADWLAEWKKHWKPTRVGSFVITPPWEHVDCDDKTIVISIEPSMAFGTGTHETTRLCIGLIEEHFRDSMSFLDVGTGTGILSIAAAKIAGNARDTKFFACDIDEDSITIARENALSNRVPGIEFETCAIGTETPAFDFVCANLTLDVILPILPLLLKKTKQILVLSGVLLEQETKVLRALESVKLKDVRVERDGEWIAVVIRK